MQTPRSLRKNSLRTVALAAGLTVVAAACGDSSDDSASTTVAEPTTTVAPAAQADDTTDTSEAEMSDEEMADEEMSDEEMSDEEMSDDMAEEMAPVTFTIHVENISGDVGPIRRVGVFNTPDGADAPGPLVPGSSYSSTVAAAPGERLSFASMFVQSNDWFVAPGAEGIALYDDAGDPISGDISDQLFVYDGGTEVDQVPGEGADQAPRQAGPDTGDVDPDNTVRLVEGRDAAAYVSVSIEPTEAGYFELTFTNVSENASTPTPFAPGVTVVHQGDNPLFVEGEADLGMGLEALAEDGNPAPLADSLTAAASVPTPIAPVAAVVHQGDSPIFVPGEPVLDNGLEILAEDGGPAALVEAIGGVAGAIPTDGTEPGPALPGSGYTFEVEGHDGDRLSLAFMFVQSNDWFFSIDGLDLYVDGSVVSGDITDYVTLWDAGTEEDQTVGIGADQAPRQAGPNTGAADDDDTVRMIGTGDGLVRVTISSEMMG